MIHLNQAGTSWPKPESVHEAMAEALAAPPDAWPGLLETWHQEVAEAFGIGQAARLLLTPGATSALAVAVSDHPWRPGDRVLCSGLEHQALHRPLLQLASRGVELVVLPRTPDEPLVLEALENELRRGGVRMVALTAACNVTGELLPIDRVVSLAREHGALSLVDAAQVAGWMPLPETGSGADLWVFAGHKGPHGPWGIGGLCRSAGVKMTTAHGADAPDYCDVGAINLPALAGLAAGLRWIQASERTHRLRETRARFRRLSEWLRDREDVFLHGPPDPDKRMPTLALTFRDRTIREVSGVLSERGVHGSVGMQCAPLAHGSLGTPDGVLRLSAGPFLGDEDLERARHALELSLE